MAIYAVGDVQGCYDALMRLLDTIAFDEKQDTLWFAGDLVNRGPDSLKVLEFVKALGDAQRTVLGNHDLHLLAVYFGAREFKKTDSFDDVLSYEGVDELMDWLRHLPLMLFQQDHMLAHAGLYPKWSTDEALCYAGEAATVLQGDQAKAFFHHMYGNTPSVWSNTLEDWDRLRFIVNAFTRMRFCTVPGELDFEHSGAPGDQPSHLYPWFDLAKPTYPVLFGHWAALEAKPVRKHIYPLDAGCVWGGFLQAVRVDDGSYRVFQVR